MKRITKLCYIVDLKQLYKITDDNFKREQCSLFRDSLIYKNIVFPVGHRNNYVIWFKMNRSM